MGIRRQLAQRLADMSSSSLEAALASKMEYISRLHTSPMAVETDAANAQHYEVGTGVLEACLGPRMKYSCCLYEKGGETLAQAEMAMLRTYLARAELEDGMRILDLGCGWGSGAVFFAEMLPNSSITAFSNSKTQKEYIDAVGKEKGLKNLSVITGDVVDYEFESRSFDRVVSIEVSNSSSLLILIFDLPIISPRGSQSQLFEHMKNYNLLMAKIARAMKPGGKLFVHMFAHRSMPYDYDTGWMATHFFTGGTMSSADLLLYFQRDLHVRRQWWVSGLHYSRTCEDWLHNMLGSRHKMWPALVETYGGEQEARVWWNRWQVFYMACSELFAYEGGDAWGIVHYLFEKPAA